MPAACRTPICEGDDFWLTSGKLAYQCSALDQLPHIDLTFHKVARMHWQTEQLNGYYADYGEEPKLFAPADVIVGDGGFIPTPSLMCRRDVFDRLPQWFFTRPPVEDYFVQVFGALRGGALYLPLCAAAYREGDPTSWSQRVVANPDITSKFELGFTITCSGCVTRFRRISRRMSIRSCSTTTSSCATTALCSARWTTWKRGRA